MSTVVIQTTGHTQQSWKASCTRRSGAVTQLSSREYMQEWSLDTAIPAINIINRDTILTKFSTIVPSKAGIQQLPSTPFSSFKSFLKTQPQWILDMTKHFRLHADEESIRFRLQSGKSISVTTDGDTHLFQQVFGGVIYSGDYAIGNFKGTLFTDHDNVSAYRAENYAMLTGLTLSQLLLDYYK